MNCEKCGSKYILISRTTNNEIVSIMCTSCGHIKIENEDLMKKISGGLV
jgi:hypothetical protein